MQLSSLSNSSHSTRNSRYKERRAGVGTVGAAPSSVRFPIESQDTPATSEPSAAGVNNVSYIYKPMADLLGLIANSDAGALGGSDAPDAPDFLGDLSWLFSPRGAADSAAPAASASAGSGSVNAANAAYDSSMHLADEEMDA